MGRSRGTGPSESDVSFDVARLTQKVIEQLADVFVGLESVVNGGLEAGVDVPKVQLAIEGEEDLV
jgi:hypothetical protein